MAKIGFIGMGNMGYAMLKGALAAFSPSDIIFSSPDREKCERISSETGVRFAESNAECGNNAKYIVLAVKPQMYPTVLKNIVNVVTEESVIISIAPGITIASIKNALGSNIRVVRAMPNTPALIGEGMTGVAYNASDYSFDERDVIDKFFTSFGKVVYVDEKLMDGVVCASGSSPAYVYMFIEALADSVVKYGFKRDDAYKMDVQTVLGSAKMVLESGEHPAVLKDKVCSPGGTTIQAVSALEENGFRNALIKATDACYDKCTNIKYHFYIERLNMKEHIKRVDRILKYKGSILDIYTDVIETPDGHRAEWDYIDHRGAAAVVPVLDDGRLLMVRQYRDALDRETIEIPAGGLNGWDEPTINAAARELEEETGYRSDNLTKLVSVVTAVAFCNEVVDVYLATGLVKTSQHLDEDEFIDVEKYTLDELKDMIFAGTIQDSKTISAVLAYDALLNRKKNN